MTASLPDIHLKDIGKGGASPAEVFNEIFAELSSKVNAPSVTAVFDKGMKSLGEGTKKVEESAREGVEAVTGKIKGLFGK